MWFLCHKQEKTEEEDMASSISSKICLFESISSKKPDDEETGNRKEVSLPCVSGIRTSLNLYDSFRLKANERATTKNVGLFKRESKGTPKQSSFY